MAAFLFKLNNVVLLKKKSDDDGLVCELKNCVKFKIGGSEAKLLFNPYNSRLCKNNRGDQNGYLQKNCINLIT